MGRYEETVEGFFFEDDNIGRQAMREYQYIGKMKDKLSELSPEQLKEFYHKLLSKNIFSTQVGYTFLYEIRSTLVEGYHFKDEELEEIVIPKVEAPIEKPKSGSSEFIVAGLKRKNAILTALVVILIVVIIGFFAIIATNDNIGYINTENKILDKYSQWEAELDERERILEEREQQLNDRD